MTTEPKENCDKCGAKFYTDFVDGPSIRYIECGILLNQKLYIRGEFGFNTIQEKSEELLLRECEVCGYKWKEPVVSN